MSSLTRSITDRVFVGLLGAVFAPLSGFFLYVRYTRGNPADGLGGMAQLLVFLVLQFCGLVFLGSLFAMLWALFTPEWIEQRLRRDFRRFGRLVLFIALL